MLVGIPKESYPDERRVALVPAVLPQLAKHKLDIIVEAGAGIAAGYRDEEYTAKGARIVDRDSVFEADIVLQVRAGGANPEVGKADAERMRPGQVLVAFVDPLTHPGAVQDLVQRGVTVLSMEMMPRITRAQSMDALSSMATVAGDRAVLMAAMELPRMFPMLMTAAGTLTPCKVFVIGAGVAGLQAIATARRLGAVVRAYDVRPAVKEQVESLGGSFVELALDSGDAQDAGGYAKAQSDDFLSRQRELMKKVVGDSHVVITTAAIPGRKAPILVTEEMVGAMAPGSVIVDMAAALGGNCALTVSGETVDAGGVKIMGPENIPSLVPYHASQMYAKNITTYLLHLVDGESGDIQWDMDDEITRATVMGKDKKLLNDRVRELLGLSGDEPADEPADEPGEEA
jgi:NAD(P) transhydrogenase subunit alpha